METLDESPAQQEKSAAILDAARQHFAQQGFEAAKLAAIARDAGVAVGTIYLRYKGKADLLSGVLASVEAAFCEAMNTPDIWATPFPERFQKVVAATFEAARNEAHLPELMALSSYASGAESGQKRPMLQLIESHIRDGAARGELRSDVDPSLSARMAYGMVDGAMRAMMEGPSRDPAATIAAIADAYTRWLSRTA